MKHLAEYIVCMGQEICNFSQYLRRPERTTAFIYSVQNYNDAVLI